MPFIEYSTAPPFVILQSQQNGVRFKAKSANAARSRIDDLLARCEEIQLDDGNLDVTEPCTPALIKAFYGRVDKNCGLSMGGFPRDDVAEIVARVGHTSDPVAAEAWERFGPPRYIGFRRDRESELHIIWTWQRRDGVPVEMFEAWHDYLVKHQALIQNEHAMRAELHAEWSFRFRSKTAGAAADPFPRSRMRAYLAGRRQHAHVQLVLPYDQAAAAFRADHKTLNKALQVELPLSWFKLSRPPKKQGGRRSFGNLK